MSKAVLIIDMPKRCSECDLYSHHRRHCGRDNHAVGGNKKPDWCPLIKFPDRINVSPENTEAYVNICADGWNACIDYLEGKENE